MSLLSFLHVVLQLLCVLTLIWLLNSASSNEILRRLRKMYFVIKPLKKGLRRRGGGVMMEQPNKNPHTLTHTHTHTHTRMHMHMCTHTCMHTCMCMHTHLHTHVHTHMCTHTHTHTHRHQYLPPIFLLAYFFDWVG